MIKLPFFPIVQTSYGGNQAWFSAPRMRGDGCGVIAGTNLFFYYKKREKVSKGEYMQRAHLVYESLSPLHFFNPFSKVNSYGLPFFKRTMERVGRMIGKEPVILKGKNLYRAKTFIRKNILQGHPVVLLIIFNRNIGPLSNHYVTITSFRDEGEFRVGFSTWGRYEERNLAELLEGSFIVRMGAFND